jgi:UDP-N-acetylglucosamine 2-epimerase
MRPSPPKETPVKIVSIVGARPEFVQVAVLAHELRRKHQEILIHTGQHYDHRMSEQFFSELDIPEPDVNLEVGSLPASEQTAGILAGLAAELRRLAPDLVIVRGDTNSTLAGAIAAKQLLLPLVHVEAGMRSYDRTMPEEINRIVTGSIADLHLATDDTARERLAAEGIVTGVHVCGDVMYDVFLRTRRETPAYDSGGEAFDLLTLHRAENTDDRVRLRAIVAAFEDAPRPVIFPIHPRTRARLAEFGIPLPSNVRATEPLAYREMVALESGAFRIFTDSGGVQREAYFAEVPCVTLRDTTEWTNTVATGWNRLAGASTEAIRAALHEPAGAPPAHPPLFGDGHAAERIAAVIGSPETERIVATAHAVRRARGVSA